MQVGFIGTGTMGRILIEALIEHKALQPRQIHASNRTFDKVKELAKKYTGLHAYPSNIRISQKADVIFICVKPLEYKTVIDEIKPHLLEQQLVISITSPVSIDDLENQLSSKIAKVIPSITNASGQGASLLMAGKRLTSADKEQLYALMKPLGRPLWIEEKYTRVSSDIISCGPAFVSALLEKMALAAEEETGLPQKTAKTLLAYMLTGMAALLAEGRYTLDTLQEKVAVPGGVTAVGLQVLQEEVGDLFHQLFRATHLKFEDDVYRVKHHLEEP